MAPLVLGLVLVRLWVSLRVESIQSLVASEFKKIVDNCIRAVYNISSSVYGNGGSMTAVLLDSPVPTSRVWGVRSRLAFGR